MGTAHESLFYRRLMRLRAIILNKEPNSPLSPDSKIFLHDDGRRLAHEREQRCATEIQSNAGMTTEHNVFADALYVLTGALLLQRRLQESKLSSEREREREGEQTSPGGEIRALFGHRRRLRNKMIIFNLVEQQQQSALLRSCVRFWKGGDGVSVAGSSFQWWCCSATGNGDNERTNELS